MLPAGSLRLGAVPQATSLPEGGINEALCKVTIPGGSGKERAAESYRAKLPAGTARRLPCERELAKIFDF